MNKNHNKSVGDNSTPSNPRHFLSFTIELEKSNAFRIAEIADRFRPFSPKVSSALDALAKKLKSGHVDSQKLYGSEFGDYNLSLGQGQDRYAVNTLLDVPEVSKNFFVLNNAVAQEMLQAMRILGNKISKFYMKAIKGSKNKVLLSNYNKLLNSELTRIRRIKTLQS